MQSVKVVIELKDSDIKVASSVPDASMIVLLLEKAKLKVLNGIRLEEKSSLVTPRNGL